MALMPQGFKLPPNAYEHAITWLQTDGTELYSTQGNLFDKIRSMKKCFVVDSNAEWFSAAAKYPDVASVLGTTIDKETGRLESVFANSRGRKVRPNVFDFGVKFEVVSGLRVPLLIIRQLDEMYANVMDLAALRKFDATNDSRPRETLPLRKKQILNLLSVNRLEDLPTKGKCLEKDESLKQQIQARAGRCVRNFARCVEVSEFAYARLLIRDRAARNSFSIDINPNVFGDAELIHNALFFGAQALSEDSDVHFMARACSIKFVRPNQL